MICKNCKTRNEDNSKFCMKCGNNLSEQTPIVFCSECLEMVEQDDKFCGLCGAPVANGITEDEMVNKKANNAKEAIYQQAIIAGINAPTVAHYKKSVGLLTQISGYKDADDLFEKYTATINSKVQEEALNAQQSKQKLKRIALITVPLCCILIIGVGVGLANSADTPTFPKETAQADQDVEPTVEATENPIPETTEEETAGNNSPYVEPPDNSEGGNEPSYQVPETDPALQAAAIAKANEWLTNYMGYSRAMIINQVVSYVSCTREVAEYAADNSGADWNEQAVLCAHRIYLYPVEEAAREDLIAILVNTHLFTESQAVFAADFYGL